MKKNLTRVSAVLASIFLLSACSSRTKNDNANIVPPQSNQADQKQMDTVQTDPADLSSASVLTEDEQKDLNQEKNNYQTPAAETENLKKDEDLMAEAMKSNNPEKCNEIKDQQVKTTCQNNLQEQAATD